ncbi:CDK-activating kinase assembly factor MAT1-domain-containing protein [Entophlyctis helioformis]|nr:CDK-activating kinase assembly factor MAT1-domain-containing protein [Entophlyctis helioformis]
MCWHVIQAQRPAGSALMELDIDNERCPVCKSDRYLNPTMRLLVSPCFHKMCESCINRLFLSGPAPCPICKVTLRKSNFVAQTFEDLHVEKEIQIRKKVASTSVSRTLGGNLRAYNDYLEEVEEIMFNLIEDVDVQQTQERIERFRLENKDIIAANMSRQMTEDKMASLRLEREKREKQLRKEAYIAQVEEEAKAKKQEQADIINKLASGEADVKSIVKESKSKRTQLGLRPVELPTFQIDDIMDNDMENMDMLADDGPFEPFDGLYYDPIYYAQGTNFTDPMTQAFRSEDKAVVLRAGGFQPSIAQQRALSSAFSGIFANT